MLAIVPLYESLSQFKMVVTIGCLYITPWQRKNSASVSYHFVRSLSPGHGLQSLGTKHYYYLAVAALLLGNTRVLLKLARHVYRAATRHVKSSLHL